jgi:hypothetical protein
MATTASLIWSNQGFWEIKMFKCLQRSSSFSCSGSRKEQQLQWAKLVEHLEEQRLIQWSLPTEKKKKNKNKKLRCLILAVYICLE